MQVNLRRLLAAMAVWTAVVVVAPAASASISPSATLDQSGGTQAGSTANLGMDLKFAPSSGDSPKDLTLSLPPGLIANASINGGACLRTKSPTASCQVGTGTATASLLGVPTSLPVTFDLVAPPNPADLAGLVTLVNPGTGPTPLGSPGEVTIRPGSDPAGIGINIAFKNLPNTFDGLSISLQELKSTFDGLRLPTSCPATPANISVSADSYSDATTRSASAPLHVSGCAQLPFTPSFKVTARKDAGANTAQIVTDVTQPTKPAQATASGVQLVLPSNVLSANPQPVLSGRILCPSLSGLAACPTIGSASTTSPLYPATLTGKVYLVGTTKALFAGASPQLAIVFPPPFALTLTGVVNPKTNTTTFTHVPDIPQSDLKVTLNGGPNAAFAATCNPPSGVGAATLTSQNGDRKATARSAFTVSGCTATPTEPGLPKVTSGSLSGLASGKPALSFKLTAGNKAPKISSFTLKPPGGLSFLKRRTHARLTVRGVSVKGGSIKSISVSGGGLVVTLRRAVGGLTAKLSAAGLKETAALKSRAKHHKLGTLRFTVIIKDAKGKRTTATLVIKRPR